MDGKNDRINFKIQRKMALCNKIITMRSPVITVYAYPNTFSISLYILIEQVKL
jgi:hypothetical protein